MSYTRKQTKWRAAARANPRGFAEKRIRIADLVGQEVKFKYQWGQQVSSDWIKSQHKEGEPVRDWIVKWRRAGITSSRSVESYAHAYGTDNARIGVIAHLEERAKEILQNYVMYDKSLHTYHPDIWLEKSKDNIFGIKFEGSNAQVLIGTAKNPIKIRGDGLHRLDGSEAAHWLTTFDLVMKEVCPVVPPLPGTQIVLESTGSYMGSMPHRHWSASTHYEVGKDGVIRLVKKGENEFSALFLSCLDDPAWILPVETDYDRDALFEKIYNYEPRLMDLNREYKLTPQQIAMSWRAYHKQANNDFDYFCREFPYTRSLAWSAGGTSYFGVYELDKARLQVVPPEAIYVIDEDKSGRLFTDPSELRRVESIENDSGRMHIKFWKPPIKGQRYVLGADGSQGIKGGDFSGGYVINQKTREMMCSYHGLMRPDQAAYIIVSLCRIYNNALAGPESNPQGGGTETINFIQRLNYHNIYMFRKRDKIKGIIIMDALGWWTNGRTKPQMCGELRKTFQDVVNKRMVDPGMFKDAALLDEMRTFEYDPLTNSFNASSGCYDDRVIGCAIAHQIASDEVYCTQDDEMYQHHRNNQPSTPIDQSKLIINTRSPNQVLNSLLGKNSPFMRNKFEI